MLLGALAVLAIPVAAAVAQYLEGVPLLRGLYVGVAVAGLLALLALGSSRRARFRAARSVIPRGTAALRWGRILAWAGMYAAVTGAIALAVYWILRFAE